MKCPKCKKKNKKQTSKCRYCGFYFDTEWWHPTFKWNLKVLAVIYAVLIVIYIVLKVIL